MNEKIAARQYLPGERAGRIAAPRLWSASVTVRARQGSFHSIALREHETKGSSKSGRDDVAGALEPRCPSVAGEYDVSHAEFARVCLRIRSAAVGRVGSEPQLQAVRSELGLTSERARYQFGSVPSAKKRATLRARGHQATPPADARPGADPATGPT